MTVPIGICSTAHLHAGAYANALSSMDDAEFVGVADEDDERGAEFVDGYDASLMDADELFDVVDGVVVCSTNVDHLGWIERAADAGVDVLSEKPLGPKTADAVAAVEAARAAGVGLGVAMPLRFSQPARRANALLDDGEIGTLRSVAGTNRGRMPGGWFVDPDASGGGAAMDHTVHIVDLVHWLTGERVEEVYAEIDTRMHDIPTEDVNVLSMRLGDGSSFSLDGSWSRPDDWDFWGDATVELVGTDGVLSVDCFGQTFKHTREGQGISSSYWGDDPNRGLIADFVEAVRTGDDPEITGPEGVEAVAVVDAAYESAESGEPVSVSYPG